MVVPVILNGIAGEPPNLWKKSSFDDELVALYKENVFLLFTAPVP